MNSWKVYLVVLVSLLTVGACVGYRIGNKPLTTKPHQSQEIIFEDETIRVQRINNRGDINIKTPSKNIIITEKEGKHKMSLLSLAAEATKIGYCYEILHWGDYNLNVGINTHTPYIGIGYSINKYSEAMIGMGTVPVIGLGIRLE